MGMISECVYACCQKRICTCEIQKVNGKDELVRQSTSSAATSASFVASPVVSAAPAGAAVVPAAASPAAPSEFVASPTDPSASTASAAGAAAPVIGAAASASESDAGSFILARAIFS